MNIYIAYCATFYYLLNLINNNFKLNEGYLGIIVSGMNPFLFIDEKSEIFQSADSAKGEDWKDIWKAQGYKEGDDITLEQVFNVMIEYIRFHKIEFGFEVQDIIDELENMKIHPEKYQYKWEAWNNACQEAINENINLKL